MKKLSILMCVLVVSMLFTNVASAQSTYEIVTAVNEQDLGSTRLGASGPISQWERTSVVSEITSSTSVSRGITFESNLSITLKNEISEFVLGVAYNWEESTEIGVSVPINSSYGDWARLRGDIHEKKVRVTMQHDVYGDVARAPKGTSKVGLRGTLIETYYIYEDIWVPYNKSHNVEYAYGENPPIS